MKRPFSLVKVRAHWQGDPCLPGSGHLATSIAMSLATLTSKSKLVLKSVDILYIFELMGVFTTKVHGKLMHDELRV